MHSSDKNEHANLSSKQVFGVDFHDFIVKQEDSSSFELASEYGLSLGEVRKLKKQLFRS
ncbi:hypothetical protein [Bacillus andreraoultii]|uniref:hypothetical protein n=1 Tax=Bacillus andreraoultii TaxID=1499685 RepID=UPI00053A7E51|nr:hypothetical protein [Bacillus andreraoultii]